MFPYFITMLSNFLTVFVPFKPERFSLWPLTKFLGLISTDYIYCQRNVNMTEYKLKVDYKYIF